MGAAEADHRPFPFSLSRAERPPSSINGRAVVTDSGTAAPIHPSRIRSSTPGPFQKPREPRRESVAIDAAKWR
jgi:hypothetical protein